MAKLTSITKNNMTPKGVAVWPRLTEPDYTFKKEAGEYSVKLRLTPEEAAPLIEKLTPVHEAAIREAQELNAARTPVAKKKNPFAVNNFYEDELDKDGNPTGFLTFSFKMVASGTNKKDGRPWTRKPVLFDAGLRPIDPKKVKIWSGSIVRVKFDTRGYWVAGQGSAGLSLYLTVVQIIELVSGGADASGFAAEEGYSADAANYDNEPAAPGGEGEGGGAAENF